MCATCDANGVAHKTSNEEMIGVELGTKVNGVNGKTNGRTPAAPATTSSTTPRNPYAPRYADFLSNVSNFNIIESTLRGEPSISTF